MRILGVGGHFNHRGNRRDYQANKMKTPLIKLLVTVILIVCMETEAYSYFPKPPTMEDTNPNLFVCGVGCIIGIAVLAVCGYVIYKLAKFCKKHLPSTPPPAPPNPPPDNGGNLTTRSITTGARVMELGDDAVDLIDIQSYGWTDGSGKTYYVIAAVELQSSTNMIAWQKELTITSWVSPAHVLSVYYNKLGTATLTNYCPATADINYIGSMPQLDTGNDPSKFFRLKAPQ